MLHGSDRHLLECALKTDEIPEDVLKEYEIRRKMYHRMGASGELGCEMIVDLCRSLGHGEFAEAQKVVVEWQNHAGAAVDVVYGSETLRGTLLGLGDHGRLTVKTERGQLDMPRYAVTLSQVNKPIEGDKRITSWSGVSEGTPVVVDGSKQGTFVECCAEGLMVQMSNKQRYSYSEDRVSLVE